MPYAANDQHPSICHPAADELVAVSDLADVLLDIRNSTDSSNLHAVVDRGLVQISARSLLAAAEVRAILEVIEAVERHESASHRGLGRLRRSASLA